MKLSIFSFLICFWINFPAYAISITFDYSYDDNGFFSDQSRRSLLETAGEFFESRITDSLDAITSFDGNQFNARFNRPDSGILTTLDEFDVAADTLVIFAGGRNLGGSLGVGGPGGFSASATSSSYFDQIRSRGEGDGTKNAVSGDSAIDFAPWGGAVSFNTALDNWYFDSDISSDDVPNGFNDFFSVALHEIAHVLGFGTADSWDNWIINNQFTGPASTHANGGFHVDLSSNGSHWMSGTLSNGEETALDPEITIGTRKFMTELDMAALDDIGWDVIEETAPPVEAVTVPLPVEMILASCMIFSLIGSISSRK